MKKLVLILAGAGLLAAGGAAVAGHGGPGDGDHPRGWEGFAARHDLDHDGAVTREELARSSEIFSRLDANGDGRIVESELESLRSSRLIAHFARWADDDDDGAVSAAEWQAFLAARDDDGDGVVDLHARHARRGAGGAEHTSPLDADGNGTLEVSDLQALFARFDTDGDGALSAAELPDEPGFHGRRGHFRGTRFHGNGPGGPGHLLGRLDTDEDGNVSRAEWDAFRPPFADVERHAERHAARFAELDADDDGSLSREELAGARRRGPADRR
jgi:Ca2+-binding EF-hand superfamily protein